MDGEIERLDRPAPREARWSRTALVTSALDRPAAAAATALVGLVAVSALLHAVLGGWVHGPFVFMDELGYERMARSFAQNGHFSLFGKGGLAYSPLYPILLSPIYALTSSMHTAYEWAKVVNAVLISLSVFPVYGIARCVLPRGRAVGVAALSVLAPLMLYSAFEMTESIAYPLCLLAVWTMLRAVRRPSTANDALLLGAIALASAARLQLIVLAPAAFTAFLLVALAQPGLTGGRLQAIRRAISEHKLLFGIAGVALVGGLARTAMNGGNVPLAGRYASIGGAHASAWRVFTLFFQQIAELDWAVGVIPFAAALLAGYALFRLGFPRNALIYASVAVACTFWLLLEVALDAAAYDLTKNLPHVRAGFADLPTVHERYLIYVVPFFLVALFAAIGPLGQRFLAPRHLVGAGVIAAVLPALIPFGTVINGLNSVHSFSFVLFGRTVSGRTVAVAHATTSAIALSALLAAVFVLAGSRRLPPPAAIAVTALIFLGLSTFEIGRQLTPLSRKDLGLPAHANWVDRAVGSAQAAIVGGKGVGMAALRETAFWNSSISRVYYTCLPSFGTDFGEQRLPANGIVTRYAAVPASWISAGRVVARDREGKLMLVATKGGTLRAPSDTGCGR